MLCFQFQDHSKELADHLFSSSFQLDAFSCPRLKADLQEVKQQLEKGKTQIGKRTSVQVMIFFTCLFLANWNKRMKIKTIVVIIG